MPRLAIPKPNELAVDLDDGRRVPLHPLWLRERSRNAGGFDERTAQRLYDPSDIDPRLSLTAVEEPQPGRYRVRFSDDHVAEFTASELLAEAALQPGDDATPALRLWDGTQALPPRARWSAAPGERQLEAWLEQFLTLGFILYTGVPATAAAVLSVAAHFGFTRRTNFGELFDVRSEPEAIDLAYTSIPLDPHTDNPYRAPVPGIQLLHCLANRTTGGLSTLVDGFAAAAALRQQDPDSFAVLSRTPVQFRYRDASTELTASAPLIELDVTGRLRAVHFSPRLDYVPLQPQDQLERFYRARRAFDRLLRAPERELRLLLAEGDLMMFDNQRVLHGRTGFDPAEGLRHLQGCYIDSDAPRSQYRVLRRRRLLP